MKLFLFPHQDDEYFISPLLVQSPGENICLFLTTGEFYGSKCSIRNQESKDVLQSLGIPEKNIFFNPQDLRIIDTLLARNLESMFHWILENFQNVKISEIYCPAYEGGHPDHDASTLLAYALAKKLSCPSFQFYLYRSNLRIKFLFHVMSPLSVTGLITERFSMKAGYRFAFLFLHYKSQIKTWIGLSLFVIHHYLLKRVFYIKEITDKTFYIRPNEGSLYYEHRGWITFNDFQTHTQSFKDHYIQ